MNDDCFGEFKIKLKTSKDYHTWSIVDIDCVKYSTMKKIVDAVSEILEEEQKEMKEYYKKED